ncbi:PEGA domain-containing protein [candidate division WWE3 bacterium]|nr:PEGA domain-containing protein [candidate division WWE3 bacterium]
MSRIIVIFILIVSVIVGVWFALGYFNGPSTSEKGTLSVDVTMDSQEVKVNGVIVGNTPLKSVEVSAGKQLVEIGDIWKEKISIGSGNESIISRQISGDKKFAYGYSLSVEPAHVLFSGSSKVVIATRPANANISLDGTDVGSTPLSLEDVAPGHHAILIKRPGYQDKTIEFDFANDRLTTINVDLLPSLTNQLEKLDVEDTGSDNGDLTVMSRAQWGGGSVVMNNLKLIVKPWNSLDVWSIPLEGSVLNNDVDLFPDFLREYESLMETTYKTTGLPFAYLIDEKGRVYEGLGIFDFDFSQFLELGYKANVAPVLVVNSEDKPLNDAVRHSIALLRSQLGKDPQINARSITQLSNLTYSTGERRKAELKWQNMSGFVWQKSGSHRLILTTSDTGEQSYLYDPESWRSPHEVGTFVEDQVLPGSIATFQFYFKAPIYTDTINERFVLRDEKGNVIPDSGISLSVNVVGEQTNMLTILDTPTGFLNVREGAGLNAPLVTTVFPGDKFGWIREENGYILILMQDGKQGWINGAYARKR